MTEYTEISCSCGATIKTKYYSDAKEWLDRHDVCLIQTEFDVDLLHKSNVDFSVWPEKDSSDE